jgi:hypothetical protein
MMRFPFVKIFLPTHQAALPGRDMLLCPSARWTGPVHYETQIPLAPQKMNGFVELV